MTRVDELKRIYAEGRAAALGADNPYNGQIVEAATWLAGYMKMLDDKMASSPVQQAYLRAQRRNRRHSSPARQAYLRAQRRNPPTCHGMK